MPTISHPARHLHGQAGQALTLVLESLPGAGLVWCAPPAPEGCRIEVLASQPASAGVGGTALQRFALSADRPGVFALRFELRRPWEAGAHAVQPVRLTVGAAPA